MATASDIMKIAIGELGYKESPANSNKTKYGKAYGMDGQPWCAMFVWWCFDKAKASKLFFNGKKSAYVPTIMDWGINNKLTVAKSSGKYGDIVGFDWDKNKSSDHIGFIEKKNSDGSYQTIEGNTAVGNNSNGGQVMRRTRYQSEISYIIRPKYEKEKKYISLYKMNARKKASLKGDKVCVIPKGTTLSGTVDANGWLKTEYKGNTVYVRQKAKKTYCGLVKEYKTLYKMNFRKSASLKGTKICALSKGTKLSGYVVSNGWLLTKYNGKVGYIRQKGKKTYCEKI